MKKTLTLTLGLLVVLAGGLMAQTVDSKTVNMTVNLKAWYDLNIGSATLTFEDQQPDISATPANKDLVATEGPVDVEVFAVMKKSDTLRLVVSATDLDSGDATIGIGAISWVATGTGFSSGTMATSNVTAGEWASGASAIRWQTGTFSFKFSRNYETQEPGDYSTTATYTLSVI